jgi:hypothetical protein
MSPTSMRGSACGRHASTRARNHRNDGVKSIHDAGEVSDDRNPSRAPGARPPAKTRRSSHCNRRPEAALRSPGTSSPSTDRSQEPPFATSEW